MKRYALLLALALVLVPLSAELAWPQAIQVREFDNVEYRGESLLTADGCHLLSWEENAGGVSRRFFQLYNQQYAPLWPENLSLSLPFGMEAIAETSDSAFVVAFVNSGLKAVKISREGALPWGAAGVEINPLVPYGLSLAADLSGGVYVAWAGTSDNERPVTIQHLCSDGTASMAMGGTSLDSADSYGTTLLIRPDNSVVVAWGVDYGVRASRVSSSGQQLWNQPIAIPSPDRYPGVGLCAFDDATFALSVVHIANLHLHRYNSSGEALWPGPVCAVSQSSLRSDTLELKLASDNSILTMVDSWSGHYLQKVSAEGAAQFASPVHFEEWLGFINSSSDIVPLGQGACAVVFCSSVEYPQPKDIQAVRVDATGAVSVHPVTASSYNEQNGTAHRVGDGIHIEWQRWTAEECGIYAQILDAGLQPTLEDNGVALHAGSNGVLKNNLLSATETGCAAAWEQTGNYSSNWQYYLQYYTRTGQPIYGPQGLRINRPGSRLSGTKRILSNGTDLLLLWGEDLDGAFSTRMQIINGSGELLLEEGGSEISSGSQGAGQVFATSYQGDWYLLWTSEGIVLGQKIRGIQALWGNGLQLTQPHPLYSGSVSNCWLSMPWLFWRVGNYQLCKRIDPQGTTQPGIPEYGKLLAVPTPGNPFAEVFSTLTVCEDNLHYFARYINTYDPLEYQSRHTFLGPDAEMLFEPVAVDDAFIFYYQNGGLWMVSYYSSPYRLRKYDNTGNLLLDQNVELTGFAYDWDRAWDYFLSNNEHLVLVQSWHPDSESLRHFYITPEGTQSIPPDNLISSIIGTQVPALAALGDNRWVGWMEGKDSNQNYHLGIRLQRLIRNTLPIPEEELPVVGKPRFTGCSPNPFNPSVSISFSIPSPGRTRLAVYDLRGRRIRVLVDAELTTQEHVVTWDGKDSDCNEATSGVYILKLDSGGASHSRRITLLK